MHLTKVATRGFFIDNLLVRFRFISELIPRSGPVSCGFQYPFVHLTKVAVDWSRVVLYQGADETGQGEYHDML